MNLTISALCITRFYLFTFIANIGGLQKVTILLVRSKYLTIDLYIHSLRFQFTDISRKRKGRLSVLSECSMNHFIFQNLSILQLNLLN